MKRGTPQHTTHAAFDLLLMPAQEPAPVISTLYLEAGVHSTDSSFQSKVAWDTWRRAAARKSPHDWPGSTGFSGAGCAVEGSGTAVSFHWLCPGFLEPEGLQIGASL